MSAGADIGAGLQQGNQGIQQILQVLLAGQNLARQQTRDELDAQIRQEMLSLQREQQATQAELARGRLSLEERQFEAAAAERGRLSDLEESLKRLQARGAAAQTFRDEGGATVGGEAVDIPAPGAAKAGATAARVAGEEALDIEGGLFGQLIAVDKAIEELGDEGTLNELIGRLGAEQAALVVQERQNDLQSRRSAIRQQIDFNALAAQEERTAAIRAEEASAAERQARGREVGLGPLQSLREGF
jgi:hypothetical protein